MHKPTTRYTYRLGSARVSEFHVPACRTILHKFLILNQN